METNDYDKQQVARDGPVKDYFKYYGSTNDGHLGQMQEWADVADLALKERQLRNRMRRSLDPNNELEAKTVDAIKYENSGSFDEARRIWTDLEKHRSSKDPDLRPTGLVAAKHMRALAEVDKRGTS